MSVDTQCKCGTYFPTGNGNAKMCSPCYIKRVAELEEELRNIAEVDYTKWADDMNTPADFVAWAKSRARHTLNLTK